MFLTEVLVELSADLGADGGISVQCLTVYVPDRDKDGKVLRDQRRWVLEGADLLARIGGGVTIMPPVEGGWLNGAGEIVWENPVLIYTFIRPAEFRGLLPELRAFLHKLGRETRQGEVAIEFDSKFYRITKFDAVSR
jgi:hypothetical protein